MATRFIAFCIAKDTMGILKLVDLGEYASFSSANSSLLMQRFKNSVGVVSYGPELGQPLLEMSYKVQKGPMPAAEEVQAKLEAAAPAGRPWPSRVLLLP